MLPKGHRAVMSSRVEPPDSLDFFCTPPWATRALLEELRLPHGMTVWEPAAGEGHMAEVIRSEGYTVFASDIHDYGVGYPVGNFLPGDLPLDDVIEPPWDPDWIITNPPFNEAAAFALRAMSMARHGVALLVRSNWLEGTGRYTGLFQPRPPSLILQFAERVAMVKGRWDPAASTATAYCWVVWDVTRRPPMTEYSWIAPGRREALTRPGDIERFTRQDDATADMFEPAEGA